MLVESQAGRRNWSVTWRGGGGGGQQELFPPEFPPLVLSTLLLSSHLFNPFPRASPGCLAAFPLASSSLFTQTFLLLFPLLPFLTSLASPLNLFSPYTAASPSRLLVFSLVFFSFFPATHFPASSSSLSPPLSCVSVAISFCSFFLFPPFPLSSSSTAAPVLLSAAPTVTRGLSSPLPLLVPPQQCSA